MAEMTAAKVKMLLESFAAVCGSNSKAKELCGDAVGFVEQQAQDIAKLKAMLDCGVQEMAEADKEIAKKDRMIEKACKRLSMTNMSIRTEKQWLAWLEKEAQGVE